MDKKQRIVRGRLMSWLKSQGFNQTTLRDRERQGLRISDLAKTLHPVAAKAGLVTTEGSISTSLLRIKNHGSNGTKKHKANVSWAVNTAKVKLPSPTLDLDLDAAFDAMLTAMANVQKAALAIDAKFRKVQAALKDS
jgi:hypothetical protein